MVLAVANSAAGERGEMGTDPKLGRLRLRGGAGGLNNAAMAQRTVARCSARATTTVRGQRAWKRRRGVDVVEERRNRMRQAVQWIEEGEANTARGRSENGHGVECVGGWAGCWVV